MLPFLAALAGIQEGVIVAEEALEAGLSAEEIRRLVRQNVWTRIRHGAYVETARWAAGKVECPQRAPTEGAETSRGIGQGDSEHDPDVAVATAGEQPARSRPVVYLATASAGVWGSAFAIELHRSAQESELAALQPPDAGVQHGEGNPEA